MPEELLICVNQRPRSVSCGGRDSAVIATAIEVGIAERGLDIEVLRIHCLGRCELGPNLRLIGKEFHHRVRLEEVDVLLDELEREIAELADTVRD